MSSGESEFYGVVKAAGIALGYQSLLRDVGHELPVRVWTDSTATIGICGRQGLGKLRHIDTHYLWVQQRVRDKTFELYKAKGLVHLKKLQRVAGQFVWASAVSSRLLWPGGP